jgi:hypothetical protein
VSYVGWIGYVSQRQAKQVASYARKKLIGLAHFPESLRDGSQQIIATSATERLVDHAKALYVKNDQSQAVLVPIARLQMLTYTIRRQGSNRIQSEGGQCLSAHRL